MLKGLEMSEVIYHFLSGNNFYTCYYTESSAFKTTEKQNNKVGNFNTLGIFRLFSYNEVLSLFHNCKVKINKREMLGNDADWYKRNFNITAAVTFDTNWFTKSNIDVKTLLAQKTWKILKCSSCVRQLEWHADSSTMLVSGFVFEHKKNTWGSQWKIFCC